MLRQLSYLILIAAAVFGATSLASAQPSSDSLLASYIRVHLTHHPDIQSMRATVEAERYRVVSERAWMNPELHAGFTNAPTDLDFHKDPMTMIHVGVMQQIPFPGKRSTASRVGEARIRAAEANVRAAEYDMTDMVVTAYYDLAAALTVRHSLERGRELSKLIIESSAGRLSTGTGSQSDVLRARLESEEWNQKLVSNQADIDRKRADLTYAVGHGDVTALHDPILPDGLPPLPPLEAFLSPDSLDKTPEIQQAYFQLKTADATVRQAKLDYWPDLSIALTYGIRQDLRTNMDSHAGAAAPRTINQDNMLSMDVAAPLPLFARGNQNARLSETRALRRSAEDEVLRARLAKAQELRTLYALLREKVTNHRIVADAVLPRASDVWQSTQLEYTTGKLPFTGLSEARLSILKAEIDEIVLRADAWATYFRWRAALGQPLFENQER